LFASARSDEAKGDVAQRLRESGLTLWLWPPTPPDTSPPVAFDALVVLLDEGTPLPLAARDELVALLRSGWLQGATIGLFGEAASLLAAADIAAEGAPIEVAGLFIDAHEPSNGTLQELIDAIDGGPHVER
jgi:hypothetical protein